MTVNLYFITNNPEIAKEAEEAGVDRVFVDLEVNGKLERQGHLDTVMSNHTISDVLNIKNVLEKADLLVRVNPWNRESKNEIDKVIINGANTIMLPMFKTPEEVASFVKHINNRAKTSLLLETIEALESIDEILEIEGIDEIHIGLNDLHLSMGLDFMFELLSNGTIEFLSEKIKSKKIMFGFGGISRIGSGSVPAEVIIAEHKRLGSESVILSREFHGRANSLQELKENVSLAKEIQKIRELERDLAKWTHEEFYENNIMLFRLVEGIVRTKKKVLTR